MKNYSSDDLVVARTATGTWAAGVPVRVGEETLVPISGGSVGQVVPCVKRGEVILPLADTTPPPEGSRVYWSPGGVTATQAEGTFPLGTAGLAGGDTVLVALDGSGGITQITPSDIAPVTVTAVDTTGAGDAFIGSFAHFAASGMDAPDALHQAARYAASSITRRGTQKSYLTGAEFAALQGTVG